MADNRDGREPWDPMALSPDEPWQTQMYGRFFRGLPSRARRRGPRATMILRLVFGLVLVWILLMLAWSAAQWSG